MAEETLPQENLSKSLDIQEEGSENPAKCENTEEKEGDPDEWKSEKFRAKVTERIQNEIINTASQVPKSGEYFEDFAFTKAKSKKEYLDLVASIVVYVSEFNRKKAKAEEAEAEATEEKTETEESAAAES